MLKEIDCDESHSRKQKSFLLLQSGLQNSVITMEISSKEVFSQSCAHAPPLFFVTYISLLNRKIKLFVFQESETVYMIMDSFFLSLSERALSSNLFRALFSINIDLEDMMLSLVSTR
jgi:hypothetical protein